jgi:NAD(P)-dependent dehydrogenase (short-subunit alcohol dehydrogenase family)
MARGWKRWVVGLSGTGTVLFVGGCYYFRRRTAAPKLQEKFRLDGRTYVVTGGTSGIGKACVKQLVRNGAYVIVGGRDMTRRDALIEELAAEHVATCHGKCDVLPLDLADATSVAAFAADVETLCGGSLHGLLNNASVIECEHRRTEAGLETTFATNVLGPFQLTNSLLPMLLKTGAILHKGADAADNGSRARIVFVGSRLDSKGWVDPAALLTAGVMFQEERASSKTGIPGLQTKRTSAMLVYACSKLCTSLLSVEMQRRLCGLPVDCLCVSPGMVNTELWRNYPQWYRALTWPFRRCYLRTPEEAAAGVVLCLVAPQLANMGGQFIADGKVLQFTFLDITFSEGNITKLTF